MNKPDIFEYVDYRQFLQAAYEAAKASSPVFSFRYFARRAGYTSPNFLKLVIKGERNLGPDSVPKFASALGLNAEERRFFEALVSFNQARHSEEKNKAFERVVASRRFRQARRIDSSMFVYLSRWYYPAIRELSARADFQADPDWIAGQLVPSIKTSEARQALELLLDMGLLVRQEDGSVVRGAPSLTTGHEVQDLAVANYHREMMTKASESIDAVESEERDISALTVAIEGATLEEIKQMLRELRERLLERCDRDTKAESVYQLNIQLFPLSKRPGTVKKKGTRGNAE
ncbi:MAG: TIGR02147 family protein [Myxococcota bacterium]|nr:TIGR02147 family protein [Myxococcota bacterium]